MKGRRLEVMTNPETGRQDVNLNLPTEPGDYAGPIKGYTADRPAVFFVLPVPEDHPDYGLRHITEPPHSFHEEEDGTLTVSPSILARRSPDSSPGWHGFLEHGVWREV